MAKDKGNARRRLGRTLGRWARRGLVVLLGLGIAGLIVMALLPKPVPVDLASVRRGELRVTIDEDGRTRVIDRYRIRAPLAGTLARVELKPGDPVEEGQVVARLVPLARPLMDAQSRAEAEARVASAAAQVRQAQADTQRARASVQFQEREATRQRRLHAGGTVPPQVLERAELALRSAREEAASARFGVRVASHQLELARAALGRFDDAENAEQMEVTSPIAGAVLRVDEESAGAVAAGQPILELGDPAHLEIAVDVLTTDAVEIEPGDRVTIERWGGQEALDAHVRLVEPSAFTQVSALGVEEQRVNVVIDLDSPRDQWSRLGDGYRVEARIVIWEEGDVLLVPASATFRHDGSWAVYRVLEGVAHRTPIDAGRRNGLFVRVDGGLEEGDRVVVHPSDRVVDGVRIVER